MRRWTKEARDARRAATATGVRATRAAIAADSLATTIVDEAETEAQRLNAMRLNAATLMLNRAMSEYAEEGARQS